MKPIFYYVVFSYLAVLVFGTAQLSGESVDLSREIEPGGAVRVDISYGHIRVVGSEGGVVRVKGAVSSALRGVSLGRDGGAVEVRVRFPFLARLRAGFDEPFAFDVDLTVEVPVDTRLFVVAKDADLEIEGVEGPVGVGVVSSMVRVRGEPSRLVFEAVSGSLDFVGRTDRLQASTLSGDLRVVGARGQVELEAATGSLALLESRPDRASLNTVSGAITLGASLEAGGHIDVETLSGEVRVLCCDPGTSFDIETPYGEILNEVNELEPRRDERGRRRLEISPDAGKTVRSRTRSGLIWLLPSLEDGFER